MVRRRPACGIIVCRQTRARRPRTNGKAASRQPRARRPRTSCVPPTALQTFDELDFAGFLAELKKQKIRLSLSQQDEWEPYFNDYNTACNTLKEQISETDKEIDSRVFDLYGLTPEERQTVLNT